MSARNEVVEKAAPVISLCIIARNEAERIGRCLESARDAVDEMIVVDTGSTDQTVVVAQAMGAKISAFAWNGNFSAARNFALEQASGQWILVMDADEELFAEDAGKIRETVKSAKAPWYYLECYSLLERGEKIQKAKVLRLFRRDDFFYRGAVHEQVVPRTEGVNPPEPGVSGVRLRHYGYNSSPETIQAKLHRYILMLEKAVAEDPENGSLYYYLGTYYVQLGEDEKALACFLQARDTKSLMPSMVKDTADCLRRLGRHEEALNLLVEGMKKFPRFTDLYFLLGTLALDMGRPEEAKQAFQTCLEHGEPPAEYISTLGVGSFLAHYNIGVICEVQGQAEEAVKHYLMAVAQNPKMGKALRRLTVTLRQLMTRERVLAYLRDRGFMEDEETRAVIAAAMEEPAAS